MDTTVSIVIPTYNGINKIKNILDSLKNQTFSHFEIIVSIDGSTDGTYLYLLNRQSEFTNLIILNNENGGRAICRNRGANAASGDILIFLDDDMRASENLVHQHLQFHSQFIDSIIVGATFEDLTLSRSDIQKYRAYLSRKWSQIKSHKLKEPYISAANFSINKDLFLKLGGFDSKLNDAEDYDFAITAFENDIDIYFYPEIIGYHDDYISCKSYIKRLREYTNAQERLKNVKPERYVLKFPFRSAPRLSKFSALIYSFFAHKIWLKIIDLNLLKAFPIFIKYKIYDLVITGLGVYYTHREIDK